MNPVGVLLTLPADRGGFDDVLRQLRRSILREHDGEASLPPFTL